MADLQQPEAPANGAPLPERTETLASGLGAKRQRRPSVRLGDIGEQRAAIPHDPNARRSKPWKTSSSSSHPHLHSHQQSHKESSSAVGGGGLGRAPSKTRPLTNLVSDDGHEGLEIPAVAEDRSLHSGEENLELPMLGIRRGPKEGRARRAGGPAARRVRTNWVSKLDEGMDAADLKSSGEDAGDEEYRDYDDLRREDSESPFREHSPSERRAARVRISESREVGPAAAAEATDMDMLLETDDRDWNNGQCRSFEGGVREWLRGLGLVRYAPVFEVHEVDDEVLPLLTLEDLKDMGINAVGSRRKMYCAIQKLKKTIS